MVLASSDSIISSSVITTTIYNDSRQIFHSHLLLPLSNLTVIIYYGLHHSLCLLGYKGKLVIFLMTHQLWRTLPIFGWLAIDCPRKPCVRTLGAFLRETISNSSLLGLLQEHEVHDSTCLSESISTMAKWGFGIYQITPYAPHLKHHSLKEMKNNSWPNITYLHIPLMLQ